MGLTNDISCEPMVCPKCGRRTLGDWQSKDIMHRGNQWKVGDRIVLTCGPLRFIAEGDDIWTGCGMCQLFDYKKKMKVGCNAFFDCDIIIQNGTIKEIKNVRVPEWVK